MNPNGLVPTLEEEDGFLLWESNSIVRYLAAKHKSTVLEPADLRTRALASKWMDWQLSVAGPAITPVFLGLDPHAGGEAQSRRDRGREKENHGCDEHDGRAARQDRLSCRRCVFLWRHSRRHHGLSLSAARARPAAAAQFRALVCRALHAQGVQGSDRARCRCRKQRVRHPEAAAKRPSKDAGRGAEAVALRGSAALAPQGDGTELLLRRGPCAAACADTM